MLQLKFRTTAYGESVYKLSVEDYSIGIMTVSHCASVLYFVSQIDGRPINVPQDFALIVNTQTSGSTKVTPFANRVFAMSHTVVHMLAYRNNKTVLIISPQTFNTPLSSSFSGAPIISSSSRSASVSLASSEEVSRNESRIHAEENQMHAYIVDEWGDCVALREEVEQVGIDKFYYENSQLNNLTHIKRKTFEEFIEDSECWCGRCDIVTDEEEEDNVAAK